MMLQLSVCSKLRPNRLPSGESVDRGEGNGQRNVGGAVEIDGTGGEESEDSVAETLSLPSTDEEPGDTDVVAELDVTDSTTNRTPQARRTESYPQRVAMDTSRVGVVNKVPPPMSKLVFSSWSELSDPLEKYCCDNYLLFRARDTRTVKKHDTLSDLQIPTKTEYSYKVFRCTHGCSQKSRSKVQRNTPSRYTGCKDRFTATVKNMAEEGQKEEWRIVLRNWVRIAKKNAGAYLTLPCDVNLDAQSPHERNNLRQLLWGRINPRKQVKPYSTVYIRGIGATCDATASAQHCPKVLKSTPADKQLSGMLDILATCDDHHVLVIRDHNEVTSGVVIQSAVQRLAFECWGESLCMDWTYGTNNLGFDLGSLLVTSATGRGVPVLDFIALDEKMEAILEFFKKHNNQWRDIETFVIDKDFKEWRVLEKCFPRATVLLCQFHTMANWKKVVKRAKYSLDGTQRDEVEFSVKQMMYSTTTEAFNRSRDGFEKNCNGECPDICRKSCTKIYQYFQEIWEWCSEMWSNHGRGNYTSREILQRIGLRPIGTSQSRRPDSVPPFLHLVAAQLLNDALAKISAQWDLLMVNKGEAKCVHVGPTQSEWKVRLSGQETCVDDLMWSCSCLFYKSRRLPCQHVMMVARKAHRFKQLPFAAVPSRRSMKKTEELYDSLENGLDPLRQVINMVKARPSRVMAPHRAAATLTNSSAGVAPIGKNAMEYVRLRREEQASMVVLSDAEKYARAQSLFEPVIEKLSGLPTVEFYEQMIKWKSVVDSEQGKTSAASSFTDVDSTAMETTESDSDSFFDQLDYADVMADMEADQELAMKADSIATLVRERNVSVQDGEDSETGESPPLSDNDECKPTQVSDGSDEKEVGSDAKTVETKQASSHDKTVKTNELPSETRVTPDECSKLRGIEVLQLPAPKRRTRKKTKQGWITPQPRFAAVLVSSKVTMTLTQILQWASYHPNVEKVSNVLDQYPVRMTDKFIEVRPVTCAVSEEANEANSIDHAFVIPEALLKKADAAMLQKKELLA
ncbi:MULE transposase domain [Phytophthora cactorum]|nr:MULE transposase domain [Phytophthora cactorum]